MTQVPHEATPSRRSVELPPGRPLPRESAHCRAAKPALWVRSALLGRRVLAGHEALEPGPLDVGQVPEQSEQRHRGRLHRAARASPAASRPKHFSSSVWRCQRRNLDSVSSSPPWGGGSDLGSGSMNMSMDMPAIFGGGRGHSQRVFRAWPEPPQPSPSLSPSLSFGLGFGLRRQPGLRSWPRPEPRWPGPRPCRGPRPW